MALVAPVEDGKVVETTSQNSLKKANDSSNNGMDKEAFLTLLVAQMQYQDPLEPTSNTEFISQYAQFSQVEQMQNMAATTELARATSLVGEEVYVKTVGSSGDYNYIYGKVDYVAFENGKAYVAIEEELYPLDDVVNVLDMEYKVASDKAYEFTVKLNKLPNVARIDMSNADAIDELEKVYNEMTDYEKGFIASDTVKTLNAYIEKLKEVRAAAEKVATTKADAFTAAINELPGVDEIDLSHAYAIDKLEETYNDMSAYEKTFINEDITSAFNSYVERLKELRGEEEGTDDAGQGQS